MKTDFRASHSHFFLSNALKAYNHGSFLICLGRFTVKELFSLHPTEHAFSHLWAIESPSLTSSSRWEAFLNPFFHPSNFEIDAVSNKSLTLPFAHRRNISRLAITPCGKLLISVDDDGHAILTNLPRRLALHYFSFKGTVTALAFSPSGRYFAAGLERIVQVWHTPSIPDIDSSEGLEFAPFVLHRLYAGHHDTVRHIEWSSDSRFFLTASRDLTARIWSLGSEHNFVPTALSGHRESLIGAWFSSDQEAV